MVILLALGSIGLGKQLIFFFLIRLHEPGSYIESLLDEEAYSL